MVDLKDKLQLLTVSETLGKLKISRPSLYELINEKKLPYLKIVGRTLFREIDIDRFIRKNLTTGRPTKR